MAPRRRLFRLPPLRPNRAEAEMLEEIDAHVALCVDHLVARGVERSAAEQQARARFGDFLAARETLCDSAKKREETMVRREWVGMILQDLVFAFRQARRNVVGTVTVVLTLALGVGANVSMFGIVDRLLLSPPSGVEAADRVVRPWFDRYVKFIGHAAGYQTNWVMYQALAAAHGFSAVGAYRNPRDASVGRGLDARS